MLNRKSKINELYNVQYLLYDVETFRGKRCCIILSFKNISKAFRNPGGFFVVLLLLLAGHDNENLTNSN